MGEVRARGQGRRRHLTRTYFLTEDVIETNHACALARNMFVLRSCTAGACGECARARLRGTTHTRTHTYTRTQAHTGTHTFTHTHTHIDATHTCASTNAWNCTRVQMNRGPCAVRRCVIIWLRASVAWKL